MECCLQQIHIDKTKLYSLQSMVKWWTNHWALQAFQVETWKEVSWIATDYQQPCRISYTQALYTCNFKMVYRLMQEIHKKNWSMTCAIRDKEPLSFVDSDARDFAISSKGNFLDISSLIDIQSLRLSSQIDIQSTAPRWPLSTAFPIREVPWSLRASAAPQ